MKLLLRIGIFALFVGLLAYVKIKYFPSLNDKPSGPPTASANSGGSGGVAPSMSVTGYVVKSERLDNKIFATGTLISSESVDIKPEVAGKVVQLNIQEGKYVNKGQLLIKLNDVDLQAQLKKLQAQLLLTEQSEQRVRKLLEVKGVSQDEYDIVINQINNIKADMEFTQAQIAKTEVRAPFSGMVGLKSISNGAYINQQSQIATIQVLNPINIDFTIPEKYVNQVRVGEAITFSTEGSPDNFSGKVFATENQIDPVTRTFKIRAAAANPGNKLRAGAFVKVDFSLKEIDNALMVPTEAIVPILKGQQVFVAKNGVSQIVVVDVGVRTENKIQILNGIQPGDTIITSGLMAMKPDMKVRFTSVR